MSDQNRVPERIKEAIREVATLFIALAPLDVVLEGQPHSYRDGLIFMLFGVILFVLALLTEGRRTREH